jgi:alpha-glucosidase
MFKKWKSLLFCLFPLILLAACQNLPVDEQSATSVTNEPTAMDHSTSEVFTDGARVRYCNESFCLMLEFPSDDILHGEYAVQGLVHDLSQPIAVSPMVKPQTYIGAEVFRILTNGDLETSALRVHIDKDLCISVEDLSDRKRWEMTTICPKDMAGYRKHLSIQSRDITDIYGLGEQFIEPGVMDGNWYGKARYPGVDQGNAMVTFNGAMAGNAQFSVAYFLGKNFHNYGLFIDDPAAQTWNFHSSPWDINIAGNAVRFFLLSGPNLLDLRQDYMKLTGTPPVPPKKMFGLWVSEYGYDNWAEMEDKLTTLRANNFPVDGFVLDLQWYGGITADSIDSRMGSLSWDTNNFPEPEAHLAKYAGEGIGIMTIEQSYISAGLPEYSKLEEKGWLVKQCEDCDPVYLESNPWWGIGGMIDWTNTEGTAAWHDEKRQPLIEEGVIGHWTDLGEPEAFSPVSWYAGIEDEYGIQHEEFDVHNLYNFSWSRSIYEGYIRNKVTQRPFILSRSGAPGSQRFGVSMWSGDLASNLESLAAHLQVQGQMSLSGMDYFGSDIGGFNRYALVGNIDNVYTPWLAVSSLLDVPMRVHTLNLCNCNETAPDRVGDVDSNLANVRLRYELSPYLYSLAHRAFLYGEPVFPPLVVYFQEDMKVRELGGEKMIGRDLLTAFSAKLFQEYLDVYLPRGKWVNYHTLEWTDSRGEWLKNVPLVNDSLFQMPVYMREGAILPLMVVDEQTMNITGQRLDGSVKDDLWLRIVASTQATNFTLYEDDGVSNAYLDGEVRTTLISQMMDGQNVTITIDPAQGNYAGASRVRMNIVDLIMNDPGSPASVTLNSTPLEAALTEEQWSDMESGWYLAAPNLLRIKTGALNVDALKIIEVSYP